jgi:hypothetical protein
MSTRTETLLGSADYKPLLEKMERIVETETKKAFRREDRELLEFFIRTAASVYEGVQVEEASRPTLYELGAPLATVIKILERETNYCDLLVALGAPVMLALSPDEQSLKRAVARYEDLLDCLHKIASAVPSPPGRRGKGRPKETNALRDAVVLLATYWERATGERFHQYWHKGVPIAASAQFVHAAIGFIDPERLHALPKVTERVVTERRGQALGSLPWVGSSRHCETSHKWAASVD